MNRGVFLWCKVTTFFWIGQEIVQINDIFVKQSFPCAFLNNHFRSILMCFICYFPLYYILFSSGMGMLILILVEDIRIDNSFWNNCYNNTFGVLILVWMEDTLWLGSHCSFSSRRFVLILVLVEDGLWHYRRSFKSYRSSSLNPCFSGRWSLTRLSHSLWWATGQLS